MPIEFRCQSCQRLLRTHDDTAGKKAQCPGCGAVVPIPGASPAAAMIPSQPRGASPSPPPVQAPLPSATRPAAGAWPAAAATPGFPRPPSSNPYESPSMAAYSTGRRGSGEARLQDGPAWEREGASYRSFAATVKEAFGNAGEFFATMRRDGGLASPLGFAFFGSLITLAATSVWFGLLLLISVVMPGNANNNAAGTALLGGLVIAAGWGFTVPVLTVLGTFLSAGTYHVMLMLLGGANQAYETTFRVVAYSLGTTSLLQFVPCCGWALAGIVAVVFTIVGLSQAHDTSGLKAAAAVLLPAGFCCGLSLAANFSLRMLG